MVQVFLWASRLQQIAKRRARVIEEHYLTEPCPIHVLLNEAVNMDWVQKQPYIILAAAYFIGRLFAELGNRKKIKEGE